MVVLSLSEGGTSTPCCQAGSEPVKHALTPPPLANGLGPFSGSL